jgi:lauroyl/myristoyl acyltransferase
MRPWKQASTRDVYILLAIATLGLAARTGTAQAAATLAANCAYRFSSDKRARIESALGRTFNGSLSHQAREKIVRSSLLEFWHEMGSWFRSPAPRGTDGAAELHGVEHLEAAVERGCGAILWESNAFGRRLAAKQLLAARGFAIHQVHGSNNLGGFFTDDWSASRPLARWIRRFFDEREKRFLASLIYLPADDSLGYARTLARRLAENAILSVAGDGRSGRRLVRLPFLGHTVGFATGMVTLARSGGAPLLPVICIPGPGGGNCLRIGPPIEIDARAAREQAATACLEKYALFLEGWVRARPGLYRNWHLLASDERAALDGIERGGAYAA